MNMKRHKTSSKSSQFWIGFTATSIIFIKTMYILKYFLNEWTMEEDNSIFSPKLGLGDMYYPEERTFKILNRVDVKFTVEPTTGCEENNKILIMVSSGPKFQNNRQQWRRRAKIYTKRGDVRLVFLVATPPDTITMENLKEEGKAFNDIVLTSVEDGHRKLGYKILSGYVWSYINCPNVKLVAKTDDNVVLDMDSLMHAVDHKQYNHEKWIACTTPNRRTRVHRKSHMQMTGNWSISEEQFPWDVIPDWCTGFLYVTTPAVGAQLVQAGYVLYNSTEVEQIEDSLITGVLRNALPDVKIDTYETGLLSQIWLKYLSHCNFLAGFKITFFNSYVISKVSSRSDTWYVGSVTDAQVWRYFLCLHVEGVLAGLEEFLNLPDWMYDLCHR